MCVRACLQCMEEEKAEAKEGKKKKEGMARKKRNGMGLWNESNTKLNYPGWDPALLFLFLSFVVMFALTTCSIFRSPAPNPLQNPFRPP